MLTRRGCIRLRTPARLYSTPSSRVSGQAMAQLRTIAQEHEYNAADSISAFLRQNAGPVLRLPEPVRPATKYTDDQIEEQLSVITVCLHNLHDVPRAKALFERLEKELEGHELLNEKLYNRLIEAYMEIASQQDSGLWIEDAYFLYRAMESGEKLVNPTAATYSLMFLAWVRHNEDSAEPMDFFSVDTPAELLASVIQRDLSVKEVLSDRVLNRSSEVFTILKALARAAAEDESLRVALPDIREVLASGTRSEHEPESVPHAAPVLKARNLTTAEMQEDTESIGFKMDVPFNIDNVRRHLHTVALDKELLGDDLVARQRMLERSVRATAESRSEHEDENLKAMKLDGPMSTERAIKKLGNYIAEWQPLLQTRIEIAQAALRLHSKKGNRDPKVDDPAPYLCAIKAWTLATLVIAEILTSKASGSAGPFPDALRMADAMRDVGNAVEQEYRMNMALKENPLKVGTMSRQNSFSSSGRMVMQNRQRMMRKMEDDNEGYLVPWSVDRKLKIGSMLIQYLFEIAKITDEVFDPETEEYVEERTEAFGHSYMMSMGKKHGVLTFHKKLLDRMAEDKPAFHPRHLPMLTPPKPWNGFNNGGYLDLRTNIMRTKDSKEQKKLVEEATQTGGMSHIFTALDFLGNTPWKINRGLFDVVLKVWNSGEALGKIPAAVYPLPEPRLEDEAAITDDPGLMKRRHFVKRKAWTIASSNNHTDRCAVNYKIEIARTFLNDTFYIPHNVDFRGRAYPIPPHLNHIGNDLSRGLMTFAEGKPLGVEGLQWLKIHLSNLYGYDKANFDERAEFTMTHLEDIIDSAENPLEGRGWWKTAGDPWQCLAACMELNAALKTPVPEEYVSFLPVHQDGTCNGLQHYAALGKDARGAAQVNLTITEKPSDVYTFVANMVEEAMLEDIAKNNKYALALTGRISRKVVKQTVMTTVYGVTFIGARAQIEKQLTERGDIPPELVWGASSYLAKQVINCIGNLFTSASSIQEWLSLCARIISKAIPHTALSRVLQTQNQNLAQKQKSLRKAIKPREIAEMTHLRLASTTSVVWRTPLGLPVVQPYRKMGRKAVKTSTQTVIRAVAAVTNEVKAQKQATAFPPNYIHSLDATHMMLTALKCHSQGLIFAAVHDSYWTHACDIKPMSVAIRDCFIDMHNMDLLEGLRKQFLEYYKDHWVPAMHLASPSLRKALRTNGVRLRVTMDTAKTLQGIESLLEVGDTDTTDIRVAKDPAVIAQLEAEAKAAYANEVATTSENTIDDFEDEAELEANHDVTEDNDDEAGEPRRRTEEELEMENPDIAVKSKELSKNFLPLESLLPPLPHRGTFDIQEIKKSPYFFS